MKIEIINTGSELLLGRTLNTHAQWLARQLAGLGLVVARQIAVADTTGEIAGAVRESLGRAELVIVTGGLGPTSDDLTVEAIARLLGKNLREDAAVLAHIENYFAGKGRRAPASTRREALVPEGAVVLPNPNGTAPGLAMELPNGKWLILLPGPSRELRPMFTASVIPLLEKIFPAREPFVCRTLRTLGLGESIIQERIAPQLRELVGAGLDLGYCARVMQVDIRLAATGAGRVATVNEAEKIVRRELGENIFGEGDEELETVIVRMLTERGRTLALAESCTGGFIANKITNVPGASAVLLAGLVTYANAAKQRFVGVRAETLKAHGAVSEAVAREMAEGARRETGADFAIAVTGIAGPGGGTADKPVGTVFIVLATANETIVGRKLNSCDRETFKELTGRQALEMLWRAVRKTKNPRS